MASSKLSIYNDAMLHIGQERLASLSEASAARYALDDAYDGVLAYCLEQTPWKFARRTVSIDYSTTVAPSFGFTYAFDKPDDYIRTLKMAANESFVPVMIGDEVADEQAYWFANVQTIYVQYLSNDVTYGGDVAAWPQVFADYVGRRLANRVCMRITGSQPTGDMHKLEQMSLSGARSKDAMNDPIKFPPRGTWVRSRSSGITNARIDRTNF